MRERLRRLWDGPAIDRAIAVLGIAGGAAVMGLFGQIVDMAVDYPAPLAAVSGVCFLLGVLLSWLLGVRDARVERMHREWKREDLELARARAEEQGREARREAARARVIALGWPEKRFLVAVADGELPSFEGDDGQVLGLAGPLDGLVDCTEVGDGKWAATLTERGRLAVECASDVLDLVRENS